MHCVLVIIIRCLGHCAEYNKRRIGITYHSVSDCSLFVVVSCHGANLVMRKKEVGAAKSSREKKNREDLLKYLPPPPRPFSAKSNLLAVM